MPTYIFNGVEVQFPFEAYDCQMTYMQNVVGALQKGQNALLESPTGTGKTLCLLCASLAWRESLEPSEKSFDRKKSSLGSQFEKSSQDFLKLKLPTIIYASRTHSQLQQVIRELKSTSYRPKMVVLGSREQMCIHKDVQKMRGRAQNQACRSLCKTRSCSHYNRVNEYLKSHPDLGDEPIDIEDLVGIGKSQGPCPYFVSRELHSLAEIIFVPYNYVIDKENRNSLTGIRWENSVVIFDEAHNLEGICADAASFDLPATYLTACIAEASQCVELAMVQRSSNNAIDKSVDPENFAVLKALLLELERRINELPIESEEFGLTRPGAYIYEFLSDMKITWETITMLTDTLDYAISLLEDDSGPGALRAKSTTFRLQYLRDAMRIVFRGSDSSHAACYRVHVHYPYKRNEEKGASKGDRNGRTFSWWCFNPGIAMEEFAKMGVRTIILTSGTLSPLESFAIELKLPFDVRLENPHVIGGNQIWVGVVCSGPSGRPLNSSYRMRDSLEYKSELGNTIVNFARIVPDGLLVFFPSYYLLNSCIDAWQTPNQVSASTVWERICKHKQPVVEPKESALFNRAHEDFLVKLKDSTSSGAIFFAVCRGKVSEGLDFADQTGRAVIVTGIPFAMKTDPKVRLKRQYLDEQARLKNSGHKVLTGEEWYVQQASRAVNQAIGRVIRHKNDYGAIILCDERFAQGGARSQISLWLRPYLRFYTKYGDATFTLTRFFKEKKSNCSFKQTTSRVQEHAFMQQARDCIDRPVLENFSARSTNLVSFDVMEQARGCIDRPVLEKVSARSINLVSFNGLRSEQVENQDENRILRRKTTEPLSKIFGSSLQQEPLSVVLAAKRDSQPLSSVAITPANRALGNAPGFTLKTCSNESKRLKSVGEVVSLKCDSRPSPAVRELNGASASSGHAELADIIKTKCAQAGGATSTKNAAEYLKEVKARLSIAEYQNFLVCMKGLKEGSTQLEEVFNAMSRLFSAPERQYLLERFGGFLPSRFHSKFEEYLAAKKSASSDSITNDEHFFSIPAGSRKRNNTDKVA